MEDFVDGLVTMRVRIWCTRSIIACSPLIQPRSAAPMIIAYSPLT